MFPRHILGPGVYSPGVAPGKLECNFSVFSQTQKFFVCDSLYCGTGKNALFRGQKFGPGQSNAQFGPRELEIPLLPRFWNFQPKALRSTPNSELFEPGSQKNQFGNNFNSVSSAPFGPGKTYPGRIPEKVPPGQIFTGKFFPNLGQFSLGFQKEKERFNSPLALLRKPNFGNPFG